MNDNHLLMHELYQTVRFMTKKMNERLQEHGIYSSQWSILYCLKKNGTMTQTEIWRYLNVEAPTVTRTLIRLEKGGWVMRGKGKDRRERIISLTDKAQALFPSIQNTMQQFNNDMVNNLDEGEQDTLYALLQKLGSIETTSRTESSL